MKRIVWGSFGIAVVMLLCFNFTQAQDPPAKYFNWKYNPTDSMATTCPPYVKLNMASLYLGTMAHADSVYWLLKFSNSGFVKADSNTTKNPITLSYAINNFMPIVSLIDSLNWNIAFTRSEKLVADSSRWNANMDSTRANNLFGTKSPIAGSSSIVTVGTLTGGAIGSGFTAIDTAHTNAVSNIWAGANITVTPRGKGFQISASTGSSPDTATVTHLFGTQTMIDLKLAKDDSGSTPGVAGKYFTPTMGALKASIYQSRDICVDSSMISVNDTIQFFVTQRAIVLDSIKVKCRATTANIVISFRYGTGATLNGTVIEAVTATSVTTGTVVVAADIDAGSIAVNQYVWFLFPTITTKPKQAHIIFYYH